MHHVAQPSHDIPVGHEASVVQIGSSNHDMEAGAGPADHQRHAVDGDEAPTFGHGLLHLCLAVLMATATVLTGWLLLARRVWSVVPLVSVRWSRWVPARPPPRPHGAALLRSLCVMRT